MSTIPSETTCSSSQKQYVNGDDDLLIIDNIKKEVVKLPEDTTQENKENHPQHATEDEWPRIDDDENGSRVLIVRRSSTSASPITPSDSDGETSGDVKSTSSPLQLHTLQLSSTLTTRSSHESLSAGVLTIGHHGHGTVHSPNSHHQSHDFSSRSQQMTSFSSSSNQRKRNLPHHSNGCSGSLSCIKDDSVIMYKIFSFLRYKDLIRASNVSSFWRKILRDASLNICSTDTQVRNSMLKHEYIDLYERECRRLWPHNCDITRYPKLFPSNTNPNNTSTQEQSVPIIVGPSEEDDDSIQNRPSILELDVGGYRAMLLDDNSENELFPIVFLTFAKMSRKKYLNIDSCSQDAVTRSDIMDIGTVEIKLNKKLASKAAENFRCLCTGEKGLSSRSIPLTFKGSTIHKAVQATLIQGGDIEYSGSCGWWKCHNYLGNQLSSPSASEPCIFKEGEGNESIFGKVFEELSAQSNIHHAGSVSLVNVNSDLENSRTYGSQFMICVNRCKEQDGKNIVIGDVTNGLDIIRRVESETLSSSQHLDPAEQFVVFIKECGQFGYTGPNFEESVKEQFRQKKQSVLEPVKSRTCTIL
ncbi:hypothetical protein FDP41_003616 [Naegleria fowleri]|uniref:PPIase cyclophilin-type domain-containing protein n=1 Tax=Naegleria fowleri TaxID=5763 RepID=A0A6A5BTR1_NAEFO|nr:uncharacterized protein FDP41_003616 [Naegleria fowleri]KAF0977624.1 hypothetical protein FDP41_003616 [Naegleria fowleri]